MEALNVGPVMKRQLLGDLTQILPIPTDGTLTKPLGLSLSLPTHSRELSISTGLASLTSSSVSTSQLIFSSSSTPPPVLVSLISSTPSISSTTSSILSPPFSLPLVFETISGGQTHTVTSFVADSTATHTGTVQPPPKSFMQNKTLVGVVFGLVGALVLILAIIISTFALRRRRSRRLTEEAISFDPATIIGAEKYERLESAEKARISSSFFGHGSWHGHMGARNPFVDPMKQGGQYMSASRINPESNARGAGNFQASRVPESISSNFASSARPVNNDSTSLDPPDLVNYKSQCKGPLKITNE